MPSARSCVAAAAVLAGAWSCAPRSAAGPASPAPAAPSPATASARSSGGLPLKHVPTPTTAPVTAADLMTRLYILADDSMEGRLTGMRGNFRGTAYLASELRKIGLEPAGENGTWFQNIPLVTRGIDPTSLIAIGATTLRTADFIARPLGGSTRPFDGAQVVFGGWYGADSTRVMAPAAARGKFVVVALQPGPDGRPRGTAAPAQILPRFPGAVGVAVASLDAIPAGTQTLLRRPSRRFGAPDTTTGTAFVYITQSAAATLIGSPLDGARPGQTGGRVAGQIAFRNEPDSTPARNVIGILRGSDPAVRGQFVAIGAHNDHLGIAPAAEDHDSLKAFNRIMRPQGAESRGSGAPTAEQLARIGAIRDSLRQAHGGVRRDSIWNGADDDGSGSVTVLEIAQALAARKAQLRRSVIFVWHTGEELGLYGSSWFTDNPTVPRDSIVAQLNMDMVGRGGANDVVNGGPGYVELIGSRRLSTELGDLVEQVNREGRFGFTFNYQFDANGDPNQYYCRSDHYEYARYGIPVTFFTTGAHQDYHQLTDEAQYIDYDKMARIGQLVEAIAVRVAGLDHRVVVDKPKGDPKGQCRQ